MGRSFFKSFPSGSRRLGSIEPHETPRAPIASSASAVAALRDPESEGGAAKFVGGVPPSPLLPISQPRLLSGGGCKGWQPSDDFVVAEEELVAAGECQWDDHSVREPLYIRSLRRGGHWRVLRWLAVNSLPTGNGLYSNFPPVLAAEGNLVAVGVQHSSAEMNVSILGVHSGHTKARFELPAGYLSFASPDRLLLSVAQTLSSPEAGDFRYEWSAPFHVALYSTRGQQIAGLGSAQEPPLVSGMHLVTEEDGTVSMRSVTGGAPEPVVAFNEARELLAVAFRWPALVVVETTSAPRLPSEIHCWSGDYGPASEPFLGIFNLAHSEPFLPAPALVHMEPSEPLTDCGPAPP